MQGNKRDEPVARQEVRQSDLTFLFEWFQQSLVLGGPGVLSDPASRGCPAGPRRTVHPRQAENAACQGTILWPEVEPKDYPGGVAQAWPDSLD
jgi:hypothetical protein